VVSQLVTELDGVEVLKDVWVIAATNRPDIIDEALLRPGRLDFRLEVPRPSRAARASILAVHLRKKPVDPQIDLPALAVLSEGLSAAEVRFLCDRAAMNAIRRVYPISEGGLVDAAALRIEQKDFDDAIAEQAASAARLPQPEPLQF
jgi:transitional endoplasmic reticulum ATPase